MEKIDTSDKWLISKKHKVLIKFNSQWEGGKGKLGQSERVAWTYIHYQM